MYLVFGRSDIRYYLQLNITLKMTLAITFMLRPNISNQCQDTPPLNRAQVDINTLKNISMAFFMSDQANLEYVNIETFPIAVFPHLQPIYVTNGLNSIRNIYQANLY